VPYAIEFESDALADLKALRKSDQVKVLQAIDIHLTHEPTKQSKSRIKRLRSGTQPPYRLRIDEFRLYYDVRVEASVVTIYGIVAKEHSLEWLDAFTKKTAGEEQSP
jgi:mRNA interferase RelE/StbE